MSDIKALGERIIASVKAHIERALDPVKYALGDLEKRVAAIPAGARGTAGVPGRDGINGLDGKSVSIDDVSLLVRAVVSEIPAPANGKDGNDGAAGKDGSPGKDGERGADGKDGQSVDLEQVRPVVGEAVALAVAALPPAQNGRDGKDADPAVVKQLVGDAVAESVAALPPAKDGAPGSPGPAGKDGQSIDRDELDATVRALVDEHVALAVAALPKAQNGRDGTDADPAVTANLVAQAVAALPAPKDGQRGDPGRDGRDGKDVDAVRLMETISGCVAKSVAAIPAARDGIDGRDALQVDEFTAELADDGRTVSFTLLSGGKEFKSQIKLAVPLDGGVFKADLLYERGDLVSYDGSGWIAQRQTSDKPGTSDAWRLAIKRGRDGKDLRPPEPLAHHVVRTK